MCEIFSKLIKTPERRCVMRSFERRILQSLIIEGEIKFIIFKSSHRRCSVTKAALKKFSIFKRKHLCWILFLIEF